LPLLKFQPSYIAVHTNVTKPKYVYFSNTLVAAPTATSQHCLQVARPVIRHVGLSRDRRGSTAVRMHSGSRQSTNRRTAITRTVPKKYQSVWLKTMEQNSSWKLDNHTAGQEIPLLLI